MKLDSVLASVQTVEESVEGFAREAGFEEDEASMQKFLTEAQGY